MLGKQHVWVNNKLISNLQKSSQLTKKKKKTEREWMFVANIFLLLKVSNLCRILPRPAININKVPYFFTA